MLTDSGTIGANQINGVITQYCNCACVVQWCYLCSVEEAGSVFPSRYVLLVFFSN